MVLALLVAAPQVQAQNKRAERKLKREMRKLEKQMDKVKELKGQTFHFNFDDDIFYVTPDKKELKKMYYVQKELGEKHREMAFKQRDLARDQARKAHELTRVYELKNRELNRDLERKIADKTKQAMELQRQSLSRIHEYYPDGSDFKVEIPNFEFEMPDLPKVYKAMPGAFEPGNTLSVKKTLDSESIEKDHNYTVSEDASDLDMKVSGSVDEGAVNITLKTPEGKEYQKIELTPAADVNWSQKIKMEGEDKESLKGKWTISVKGEKAKGNYSIYMRSK